MRAIGGFDQPVMRWSDSEPHLDAQCSPSFTHYVEAHLRLMEHNNRTTRERGGHYRTLFPGGGEREVHPALNSGDRPLDGRQA
ncbi:hypothetical protein [Nocardia neocaledoniensis]|uniref:hypothetical protein n=1 Tax=Nocardia neocaledoniensis TaxID=236511 RepID=UPI002455912F|nr:hypothetical protein [Nocardia neocaledoniensis]